MTIIFKLYAKTMSVRNRDVYQVVERREATEMYFKLRLVRFLLLVLSGIVFFLRRAHRVPAAEHSIQLYFILSDHST